MKNNLNELCKQYTSECSKGINFENLFHNYNLLTKNKQLFLNLRQEYLLEKKILIT